MSFMCIYIFCFVGEYFFILLFFIVCIEGNCCFVNLGNIECFGNKLVLVLCGNFVNLFELYFLVFMYLFELCELF